ncbi:MAG: Anti-sigma-I factor RsgI [Pelotomaculum sp. PtaB.Bin104]|nr:MAG: Anti-sigma-I factor RsgI [Pelotomaculum sp. PtaB.Bin104]
MKTSGMIVKITGKSCIVLTRAGEYKKVPLPRGGCWLGQIIDVEERTRIPYVSWLAVAASILMFALVGQFWMGQVPPAAAYLTLDINPSVELGVAADRQVVLARGLNSEGEALLQEIQVLKLDVHEAVERIVAQAISDQFLVETGENVILVTMTTGQDEEPLADVNGIYESVKNQLVISQVSTDVIIEPVDSSVRQEAEKTGLSTGRYILLQNTAKKGVEISPSEIKSISLGKLEKDKKVSVVELIRENEAVEAAADSKDDQEKKVVSKGVYKQLQKTADAYAEKNIDTALEDKKKSNNFDKKLADTKKNESSSKVTITNSRENSRENNKEYYSRENSRESCRGFGWGNSRENQKDRTKKTSFNDNDRK